MSEGALLDFLREVRAAVHRGNRGAASHPYRRGTFLVDAHAGEIDATISDISEEDAVLIAAELSAVGVRAVVRGSVICPRCGARVPEGRRCVRCRSVLDDDDGR